MPRSDQSVSQFAIWKESPPGAAQNELEHMFKNNMIGEDETPGQVRARNVLFSEYSPTVFAAHFRKVKAKHGSFEKSLCSESLRTIPQLGKGASGEPGPSNAKKIKFMSTGDESLEENKPISFKNAPFVAWAYVDHEQKCSFVNVAVPIFSGSESVNFEVSDDGLKVIIDFVWPKAIFQPKILYQREIDNSDIKLKITAGHPKIQALSSHLLENEISELTFPTGSITIKLPVPVVRDPSFWVKKPMKLEDGSKIVLLEMKAFQDKTIVKDSDTSLVFE